MIEIDDENTKEVYAESKREQSESTDRQKAYDFTSKKQTLLVHKNDCKYRSLRASSEISITELDHIEKKSKSRNSKESERKPDDRKRSHSSSSSSKTRSTSETKLSTKHSKEPVP